ncbi:hypothetical protein V8C86DRAFT_2642343, partial [Haematococcus lacustris]
LLPLIGGPSNRPTASRPLYCATFLGTCAHLCARTARVLGLITLLLLGCAAWAAALAASIATTLDATSPATAETSAGTAAGEQPVIADGMQKDEGRTAFESIHRQHKSSPDLPRSMLVVLGNGWRDGDSGHLGQLSYTCLICLHSTTNPSPNKGLGQVGYQQGAF